MSNSSVNPWIKINIDEYEGHMSDASVLQLQALNSLFKNLLDEHKPTSICVPGCSSGNGFEHIDVSRTKRIVGIDINKDFLKTANERYSKKIPGLELIDGDFADVDFENNSFDLIFAALFFEYVDLENAIRKIASWLKTGGRVMAVLQLPNEKGSPVSDTKYTSLKILSGAFNYVQPQIFCSVAINENLSIENQFEYDLKTGKKFHVVSALKK